MLALARHTVFGFLLFLLGAQIACYGGVFQDPADGNPAGAYLNGIGDQLCAQQNMRAPFFFQFALTEINENEAETERCSAPSNDGSFDPRMVDPPLHLKCREVGTFLRHGDPRASYSAGVREHVRMAVFLI